MRRYVQFGACVIALVLLLVGCQHKAIAMQEDGIWEERREYRSDLGDGECEKNLSINVLKVMTEEEMLEVLDYYWQEEYGSGKDKIESGGIVKACYAVFYKGNTYEPLQTFKYCDGGRVSVSEDEEYHFNSIILNDQVTDKAEQEENGENG